MGAPGTMRATGGVETGVSTLWRLGSETARAVEGCVTTSVSATVGKAVSVGLLSRQITSTINTTQMTTNQKTERLIFICH